MVHAGYYNEDYLRAENVPVTNTNGQALTITQMIKLIISSATKSELAVLFISAKEM